MPNPSLKSPVPPTGLTTRRVPIDSIHPDPDNLNRHSPDNLRQIRDSLIAWGQVEPLVVRKSTGRIIGGNGRYEAMRDLGYAEVDVTELDVSDGEAAVIGLALNRTAKTSQLDPVGVAELLEQLRSEGIPVEAAGFVDAELDLLLESIARDHAGALGAGHGPAGMGGDHDPAGRSSADHDPDPSPDPPTTNAPVASTALFLSLTGRQAKAWAAKKAELGISDDIRAFVRVAGLPEG